MMTQKRCSNCGRLFEPRPGYLGKRCFECWVKSGRKPLYDPNENKLYVKPKFVWLTK